MFDLLNDLLRNYWPATVVFTLIFGVVYQCVLRNWSFFSDRNVKCVRGWPIFGSAYGSILGLESGAISYQKCYEAFPNEKFIGVYETFGAPSYLIRDPDLIRQMTTTDFDHFVNHKFVFEEGIDPLIDRALFFMENERWRQMRAKMSPNFTGSRMRSMLQLIVRYTESFVPLLAETNDTRSNRTYNTKELVSKYSNDIIATTVFGIELNSLKDPNNEFIKVGTEISNFGLWTSLKLLGCLSFPTIMKALKVRLISQKNCNFLRQLVGDNIEQRKKNNIVRNDFIDLMIKTSDDSQISNDTDADHINIGFATIEESTTKRQQSTAKLNMRKFISFYSRSL